MHIRTSLGTRFQLKLTVLIFWTKSAQKVYSRSKAKKVNNTIEFCISELLLVPGFSFKLTTLNFGTKFAQKRYFRWKNGKSEHHHLILDITRFKLKVAILIFWIKFVLKIISGLKQENWTPPLNSSNANKPRHQDSA